MTLILFFDCVQPFTVEGQIMNICVCVVTRVDAYMRANVKVGVNVRDLPFVLCS